YIYSLGRVNIHSPTKLLSITIQRTHPFICPRKPITYPRTKLHYYTKNMPSPSKPTPTPSPKDEPKWLPLTTALTSPPPPPPPPSPTSPPSKPTHHLPLPQLSLEMILPYASYPSPRASITFPPAKTLSPTFLAPPRADESVFTALPPPAMELPNHEGGKRKGKEVVSPGKWITLTAKPPVGI
ncbi:hypothetical protein DFH27DRAFT_645186, partial [Peziza echinospora]